MDFVADSVPAILVLGGILLFILGKTTGDSSYGNFGIICLFIGVIVYLLKEKIIKIYVSPVSLNF